MLRIISDSFKNIVILGGTEPRRGEEGAVSIEMKHFLPNSDSHKLRAAAKSIPNRREQPKTGCPDAPGAGSQIIIK